ncbi:MAG: hypothetical protein ACFWT6_06510 [Virgibacillus proomii]
MHVEFGIVALAHNLLKVAGLRLAIFIKMIPFKKAAKEICFIFLAALLLRTYRTDPDFCDFSDVGNSNVLRPIFLRFRINKKKIACLFHCLEYVIAYFF